MSPSSTKKFLISACLAGVPCSYDGKDRLSRRVLDIIEPGSNVLICPEQAGGMPTPREAVEITGGDGNDVLDGRAKVVTQSGKDVTEAFIAGARGALELAQSRGCARAVFKARSPSCGSGRIYDGTFTRSLRRGDGVTAALLKREGIKVVTDEEI